MGFKAPIPAPPPFADAARNLLIASVCRHWRRLAKRRVTTLSVKEDLLVSLQDLSAAVACFPNLTHLHLSDNSVETLNDAFLAHLASSCPKLTTLHVGWSFPVGWIFPLAGQGDASFEYYLRKEERPISTDGLDRFFLKLPRLEQLSIFSPHQATKLPGSFFQLRHLRTLVLHDASALKNADFASLTTLATVCVAFPWNLQDLATLFLLPRLAHLSTFAPYQSPQPLACAARIVPPSCLKSLAFAVSCPEFDIVFPSAPPFTGLEELLIEDCTGLTSLPHHIDESLPCLRKLTTNHCEHLVDLPQSFASLSRLETLVLRGCNRLTLPSNFGDLPALKLLVLEFLTLWELPPSFCHLSSLEALIIAGSTGEDFQLPAGFCGLTALKALFIAESDLALPEDVGALASLKALKLVTYAQPFPASFTQLSSLTSLDLNNWGLETELPEALGELSSLQELKIQTLRLGGLRKGSSHVIDISQLLQLRELELGGVRMRCGPAEGGRLPCLEQLEQLGMGFTCRGWELPIPLIVFPHLRHLTTCADEAYSLPGNMAAALPQLRQLKLLRWHSEELPGSVVEITSLTSLTVEAPQLTSLPQGMRRLSRLRKLELIRCTALQHLPECLTQLHQLILRDTSITSLPANLVQLTRER
ncbi:unnamed protein product [Closterium sp. Naga37s-1]|nr:unnamed protein product [Closterium sp. Naga37s-1]